MFNLDFPVATQVRLLQESPPLTFTVLHPNPNYGPTFEGRPIIARPAPLASPGLLFPVSPTIDVAMPNVTSDPTIRGRTNADRLYANGLEVPIIDGVFSYQVPGPDGPKRVRLTAVLGASSIFKDVSFLLDTTGPTIIIDEVV